MQSILLFFDRVDQFLDTPSFFERIEIALVPEIFLQRVVALSKKQQKQELQALFHFLPADDVVFSFQLPYILGIFGHVVFGVFHMRYDVLLSCLQCHPHPAAVVEPGVYYDVVKSVLEVVWPIP